MRENLGAFDDPCYAIITPVPARLCYFPIEGWCPVESMLGTLALSAIWIAIVVAYRIIKSCLKTQSKIAGAAFGDREAAAALSGNHAAAARNLSLPSDDRPKAAISLGEQMALQEAAWMLRAKTLQALSIPQRRRSVRSRADRRRASRPRRLWKVPG